MQIPKDIIERIVNETDIVEIVSEVVTLKRAGTNFKGLCPFHGEKTPSFNVHPQKRIFHCFGCGVGGDAINFVMRHEGLSFVEAVEKLAGRLNIAVPRTEARGVQNQNELYHRINAYAHWFFRDEFKKSRQAHEYLQRRGITTETAEAFELGFAPESFEALLGFLRHKNIPLDKATELGLIRKHAERNSLYDFYRNRLIFPIRSAQGNIIGFGGRTLSQKADEAKYINSLESPVYHKSRELFGFYQNKRELLHARRAVVVEGYIDVLACVQSGIKTAVAPLGTSLTKEQVDVLKRSVDDVILMFDGDAAGQRAAAKAFATCLDAGVHPRVTVLPEGRDPGDYLGDTNSNDVLVKLVDGAPYAMDWMFATTLAGSGSQAMNQAKTMKTLISWIERLPELVVRAVYREKMARHFDISPKDLNKVIENANQFVSVPNLNSNSNKLSREELIVLSYVQRPEFFARQSLTGLTQDFENRSLHELAGFLQNFYEKQETFEGHLTISGAPQALQGVLTRILTFSEDYSSLNLEDLIEQTRRLRKKKQLKEITARVMAAETGKDAALQMQLLAEKQRLMIEETHEKRNRDEGKK